MQKTTFDKKLHVYQENDREEEDLQKIHLLMKGNTELTKPLARQAYYRIQAQGIVFESMAGLDFLDRLVDILSEKELAQIRKAAASEKRKVSNRRRLSKTNRGMLIFIFAAVFLLCMVYLNWNLFLDMKTNYDARKLQERMAEAARAARIEDLWKDKRAQEEQLRAMMKEQGQPAQTQETKPLELLGKFKELYAENPDFSGWLSIDGMKIDYPVMVREGDNNYYLDKNFAGEKDKNGLLILDYRCDIAGGAQNYIIYGHNMRSGVMFGTLKNYKDKKFGEEHSTIRFDTLYEEAEYKLVAVMLSEVAYADEDVFRYYDAIDMSTEASFEAFKENISKQALYMTDETLSYGDSCLILSTCDRYKEDGRFVVIAKKIV